MKNMWKNPEKIDSLPEHAQGNRMSDDDFVRTGAYQNIDPEYVKMVAGISEDLIGASPVSNAYIKIVPAIVGDVQAAILRGPEPWIKVTDKLPDDYEECWVCTKHKYIDRAVFKADYLRFTYSVKGYIKTKEPFFCTDSEYDCGYWLDEATHWTPYFKPEPPRE